MFAFGQVSNSETNQGLNTASRVLLERVEGLIDSRDFDEAKSLIIDSRTLINDDYGDRLLDLYFIELELESSSGENPTSPFVQFKDEELSQDAFIYLEYFVPLIAVHLIFLMKIMIVIKNGNNFLC